MEDKLWTDEEEEDFRRSTEEAWKEYDMGLGLTEKEFLREIKTWDD